MALPEQLPIVILGTSYGGLSCAHHLLKHTIPKLSQPRQIVLISPVDQVICRPATPRALISDDFFDQSKLFVSLEDLLKQYNQDGVERIRLVKGYARKLDDKSKMLDIELLKVDNGESNGKMEKIEFHSLVIATGASTPSPLHGFNTTYEDLRLAWKSFRQVLSDATSYCIISNKDLKSKICRYDLYTSASLPIHSCGTYEEVFSEGLDQPYFKKIAKEYKLKAFTRLLEKVQNAESQIVSQAKTIRPGYKCELKLPVNSHDMLDNKNMYNGINVHFSIIFEDGVKWLLRVRQLHQFSSPSEIIEFVTNSEVTVLNLLRKGDIPVPGGWLPPEGKGENERDIHYFFYEFMNGKSIKIPKEENDSFSNPGPKTRKFIDEYAKIQIAISNQPLSTNLIGCPITNQESGKIEIGGLANYRKLNLIDSPYFVGPFKNNQDRYLSLIDIALDHILNGILCQNDPLDGYLFHLQLRELVENCVYLSEEPKEVFIRDSDDTGDNFFGDDEGNFTGVLDWEWAYATTKAEAFSSPIFCFDHPDYWGGSNEILPAEKLLIKTYERYNRSDLAKCVINGKIYSRLNYIIGKFNQSACSQRAVLDIFEGTKPDDFDPPIEVGEKWRKYLIERYKEDDNLSKLPKSSN
ncbi:uncharacterized protein L201_003094 [Kwoniella dendrophila CBS 6074]|uniref:Aminoglycoside phosphotransferase domain-containing protein n=1 Tax=Kwoniella dendrophila CBS 6074 TaxID=1295534 RepID=A0AAX4JTF0_9TREE